MRHCPAWHRPLQAKLYDTSRHGAGAAKGPAHVQGGDSERLAWFAESERVHARWAMLAVAGILVQVDSAVTPLHHTLVASVHAGSAHSLSTPNCCPCAGDCPAGCVLVRRRAEEPHALRQQPRSHPGPGARMHSCQRMGLQSIVLHLCFPMMSTSLYLACHGSNQHLLISVDHLIL